MANGGTYKEFFQELENDILTASQKIVDNWYLEVRQLLDKIVYSKQPKVYERTYQLRDSLKTDVSKVDNDSFRLQVYHDTNVIRPNQDKYQHWDTKNGDNSDIIPSIVEYGGYSMFGDGYWSRPRSYFNVVDKQLIDGRALKDFKREMRKLGYNFANTQG